MVNVSNAMDMPNIEGSSAGKEKLKIEEKALLA
jgi:hypothetical protein